MLKISKFSVIRCLIPFFGYHRLIMVGIRVYKTNTDLALRLNNQTRCHRLFNKNQNKSKTYGNLCLFIPVQKKKKDNKIVELFKEIHGVFIRPVHRTLLPCYFIVKDKKNKQDW